MSEENKEKNEILESFNIISSGSLSEDIQKMDMKLSNLPDIEVKEVVIQGTGNFFEFAGQHNKYSHRDDCISVFYASKAEQKN